MQHRVLRKPISAATMTGSVDNVFRLLSIRTTASGDGWRLGDTGSALVLCQTMSFGPDDCYVMSVAMSNDQAGVGVIDAVNDRIAATQTL